MAGTLPTTPSFSTLNLRSNDSTQTTRTVNGRQISRSNDTQFWSFTASYPPMTRAQAGPIMAFIVSQRGQFGTFTVVLPEYGTTAGALGSQTVTTTNSENAGTKTIELTSGSLTLTGALKAGDLVKFNHNKVYMVMSDVDFTSGSATMTIEPGLVAAVSSGVTLDYNDVEMTCRLSNDAQEFTTGLANIMRYELDVVEDL
jgi:hypothetical protein